jgi:hypothetical protein
MVLPIHLGERIAAAIEQREKRMIVLKLAIAQTSKLCGLKTELGVVV